MSRFASINEESTQLLYAFEYLLPTTAQQHDHPLGDLGLLYGDQFGSCCRASINQGKSQGISGSC